jgi:spore maturation protein B
MSMLQVVSIMASWSIPVLIVSIPLVAYFRKVPVYECFIDGAKDGFQTAIQIIPHLVGMMVAISVFRESGALAIVVDTLGVMTKGLAIPEEVVPLGLLRPISGTGSLAYVTDLMNVHGPDSLLGKIGSTIQGSSDTTLYVLTVYFGAVGIERTRYALKVGLLSDLAGFLASVYICMWLFK